MGNKNILDITVNIKQIEILKSRILSDVSQIFENMAMGSVDNVTLSSNLAEIIMNSYILAKKMGFNYDEVQENIFNKLKLAILSNEGISDYNELSDWLKLRND